MEAACGRGEVKILPTETGRGEEPVEGAENTARIKPSLMPHEVSVSVTAGTNGGVHIILGSAATVVVGIGEIGAAIDVMTAATVVVIARRILVAKELVMA